MDNPLSPLDAREAELIAQLGEAHELVRRVAGQPAAVVLGVGGEHADRVPVEPGERADQRAPVARSPGVALRTGLGLWNSMPGTIAVEVAM